jgi:hypothetical protein
MSCTHPSPDSNNSQSPIFYLSRELRDEIWSHLVTTPKVIPLAVQIQYNGTSGRSEYFGLETQRSGVSIKAFKGFSILRVCRQINTEASEVMLSRNTWHLGGDYSLGVFAHKLCTCKAAQIRHLQLSRSFETRPWNPVVAAVSLFGNLRLVAAEMTTNTYANRAGVDAAYIARQMSKRWTGFADAVKGSMHLEKVYVSAELDRLPLKDGIEGPLTSIMWEAKIVLTSARGLQHDFNKKFFAGNARELDIQKEIYYWQNWDCIDKEAYNLEVEEAEQQWEGNTCQDDRYMNSDGETEEDSDEEERRVSDGDDQFE